MKGITDASLAGTGLKAADLNGVRMPGSMASEFVEGVRDRKGGMLALQARPTENLDLGLTGFYSKMTANNYGRLTAGAMYSMLLGKADPLGATGATAANTLSGGKQVFAEIWQERVRCMLVDFADDPRVVKLTWLDAERLQRGAEAE